MIGRVRNPRRGVILTGVDEKVGGDGFRLTELVAAISLATDLGTGQPIEHALRTCLLSASVVCELGLDRTDAHYVALLRFLGCTADAPDTAALTGGDTVAFLAAMAPVAMGGTFRDAVLWRRAGQRGHRTQPGSASADTWTPTGSRAWTSAPPMRTRCPSPTARSPR